MADSVDELLELPFFEPSHRELVQGLEVTVENRLASLKRDARDADWTERETTRRIVDVLADDGWLEYAVPAPHGRSDRLDVRSLALIRQILASAWGLADFAFALQGLGSGPISLFGTETQKRRYLADVVRGDAVAAFALSEHESGSDVASLSTRAERQNETYVLNGRKAWISNAGLADFYVVFARTGEDDGAKGISAFVVEPDDPGFEFVSETETMSPHPLGTVAFEDCRVPDDRLIGEPGDGFKVAMATLDIFRSTVGAAAAGFAEAAYERTLEHVQEREVFDGTLADLQMTQDDLAQMATDLDAARLLVYRAAWRKDDGADRITREASMAKYYATEAAQEIVDSAVQLFGARGLVTGTEIERLYRDVRPLRIYEGASEIQKVVIARHVLDE